MTRDIGARKARAMAIEAVKKGAGECLVRAVYAPNVAEPLDVQVEMTGESADLKMRNEEFTLRRQDGRGPVSSSLRLRIFPAGIDA